DGRRDGVQFIRRAHGGLSADGAGGGDDSAEAREQTRDAVDDYQMAADIDAGNARRLHVAADGVSVFAVFRVTKRYVEDDGGRDEDDDRHRARSDEGIFIGQHADRLALGVEARQTTGGHHHAQRRDEGRYGSEGDQRSV